MGAIKTFSEFVNEKYDNTIMDEKIKGYVEQISDALTDDALDYLIEHGNGNYFLKESVTRFTGSQIVFLHEF